MGLIQSKYFEYGEKEIQYLKKNDAILGAAIERAGKVERTVIPDLFTALIYAIVGQLISVKALHTIWNRILDQIGDISPSNIARHSANQIQQCGMTMKKATCIHRVARVIAEGSFDLEELYTLSDRDVITKLITLDGVGKWTAEMLLINCMERPDIVSYGDIAIRRGMMKLYGLDTLTKEQFEMYSCNYSPFGSVASIYLWDISMIR